MANWFDWLLSPFTGGLLCVLLGAGAVAVLLLWLKRRQKNHRQSRLLGARLRDIGELAVEEACCTLVHCTKEPRRFFGMELPLMRERCIFTIDALVKIGFDFDRIDVQVNDWHRHIILRLPPLRILTTVIQYESMRVFDEKTGVFARPRVEWYKDSMLSLCQEAEEKVQEYGAIERAKTSAKLRLEAFVGKLYDLTEYTLEIVFSDGTRETAAPGAAAPEESLSA